MNISLLLSILLIAPLLGALIAGLGCYRMRPKLAHCITILGISCAFLAGIALFWQVTALSSADLPVYHGIAYGWGAVRGFELNVGFLVDRLTAVMTVTVTFVSLLVHVYSIGYMRHDPGYVRFFCYMSLFTFFMLLLVTADNFFLLFVAWEGVGLVSYLLIGFWFQKISAAEGSLKAFIINRIGDLGLLLGIAAIFAYCGTLDYVEVFRQAPWLVNQTVSLFSGVQVPLMTLICLCLFVGAMGKSAQVPLHVWLPESMEGPTPISALIHAATMVTAGVYMVARLSPLFELSPFTLSVILIIGSTGALFLGMGALVQDDIKRVIAYSTLSQLGYMMAANGASAFSVAIFHLMTHAGFKALLFLAAGSVIIGMHHEQDMRKMGGLYRAMPVTYITFLIGALALAAIPPFSGFYSKEPIIEVVHLSTMKGATYAYICLLFGSFVTALYIFRAFFLTFHTPPRWVLPTQHSLQESPLVILVPLILLAIFSLLMGVGMVDQMLYDVPHAVLGNSIAVTPEYDFFRVLRSEYTGIFHLTAMTIFHLPVWFATAGIAVAWLCYVKMPQIPSRCAQRFSWVYQLLIRQYGFDAFNRLIFVRGVLRMSEFFFHITDQKYIDHYLVDGSGRAIERISKGLRHLQSGYIYHYALAMILGLLVLLAWFLLV